MIDLKLAALMSSKLCHDIIGPVGAVNNGIELLQDESSADMREQAIDLVSQSAGEAAARLQFYRLAYGLAGGMGPEVSLRDARNLTKGYIKYGKVQMEWPDDVGGAENLSKDAVKVLCNLASIAVGALPRGGNITVSGGVDGGDWRFTFTGKGRRAGLREEITKTLIEGYNEEDLTAQNVAAQYMMAIAQNNGFKITVDSLEEETVIITASSS